ncbi:MAG TPA: hypothetical protein P5081_24805 [Phycisphaerae bacterium]|nr:hypothetical protein [Phycisphaerales bacterium]HPF38027.1 hypothetical protein [Phycisphaerae bacterium]HRW56106.1 hypothetical protein [Phycisphaerae bacterium]
MTTPSRLAEAEARRDELQRELDGLAEAKTGSDNAALAELESALTAELNGIQEKIDKINGYLTREKDKVA